MMIQIYLIQADYLYQQVEQVVVFCTHLVPIT